MNVERLHSIVAAVVADLKRTGIVEQLRALQSALQNQVSQPQDPHIQHAVAAARESVTSLSRGSAIAEFPATWRETLEDLDLADELGDALADQVDEIFARNQITLTVARDEIGALVTSLEEASTVLNQLLAGFEYFDIPSEELAAGDVEVSVLIPRDAVSEQLDDLGKEFSRLQRILGVYEELVTGSRSPLKVRAIASSSFALYVQMAPGAAACLAKTVDWTLDVYKKILDLREQHEKLKAQNVPEEITTQLEEHVNSLMSSQIEEYVATLVATSTVTDSGRKNELRIELRGSVSAIADRIDRGFNIDIRAGALPEASGGEEHAHTSADRDAINLIVTTAPQRQFVNPVGKPILHLTDGEPKDEFQPEG